MTRTVASSRRTSAHNNTSGGWVRSCACVVCVQMWSRNMTPPSQLTREQAQQAVLSSPRVQSAIERATHDQSGNSGGGPSLSRDDAASAAKAMFAGMYAEVGPVTVRTAILVMRKVWRTMYEGIRVNEEGIERLHEFARAKTPVILLPMHKSHVDYLLLTSVISDAQRQSCAPQPAFQPPRGRLHLTGCVLCLPLPCFRFVAVRAATCAPPTISSRRTSSRETISTCRSVAAHVPTRLRCTACQLPAADVCRGAAGL